jgi:arylsulfatase A-like enzyme
VRFLTAALFLAFTSSTASAAHPVFDLVANRTLAHLSRGGGLLVLAGSPGFARYVHFSRPVPTWRLNKVEDGRKVALATAQAVLEVPLTSAQARKPVLHLRLKSPAKSSVRATAVGKASPAVQLAEGWQTVTVTLPDGALVDGENKIVLGFAQPGMLGGQRAFAAVEWIQVGGEAPPADAQMTAPGADGLPLSNGGGVSYVVQVPAGGALLAGGGEGCTLKASASGSGKKPIAGGLTAGTPFDLSPLAGRVARIDITAEGCATGRLKSGALLAEGDAPQAKYPSRPKNVIVWLTDSTRADHYRAFNPKQTKVETAVMDAFAKSATLFKVGYVQGNESRVSHASLFTGMYASRHKFIAEKAKLNPQFVTLAESVQPSGLRTAGFMGNGFISKFWGFGDGWDMFKNHIHEGGGLLGADLRKAAEKWLVQAHTNPFFLYIGTIDAHVSWRAHSPWIEKYDPEPYSGPFVKALLDPTLDKIVAGQMPITERDKVRVRALYASDVSYNDQQFGELLKTLDKLGRTDDTMIVLVADHGEEFWENGKIGHGQSLREQLVHIPYAVRFPPLFPPGRAVEEGVEIVDVLPTIVDALGGKLPPDVQGESLVALAQGVGAGYPRPAISSQYELAHTMRLSRWKLWVGGSGEVRLFDAADDAFETKELTSARPLERRFVTDALGLWMAYQQRWKKTRWGVASNHKPEFAADLEQ